MDDWLCELVTHAGGFEGACRDEIVVRAVDEGAALTFRGTADGIGDLGSWEFEFGFLLQGGVGRRGVGAEGVTKVLFVVLANSEGKRCQSGQNVVGYGEGELGFGGEGLWEGGAKELGRTAVMVSKVRMWRGNLT